MLVQSHSAFSSKICLFKVYNDLARAANTLFTVLFTNITSKHFAESDCGVFKRSRSLLLPEIISPESLICCKSDTNLRSTWPQKWLSSFPETIHQTVDTHVSAIQRAKRCHMILTEKIDTWAPIPVKETLNQSQTKLIKTASKPWWLFGHVKLHSADADKVD